MTISFMKELMIKIIHRLKWERLIGYEIYEKNRYCWVWKNRTEPIICKLEISYSKDKIKL